MKTTTLHAPLERVWTAIVDSAEFGRWFGSEFDGPFVAGESTPGRMVPTEVDEEVAAQQEPHRGLAWTMHVDEIEPMTRFVFRWGSMEVPDVLTTVTFTLAPVADGVELTITETGFDAFPAERRDDLRDGNDGGWSHQARLLARYLELHP